MSRHILRKLKDRPTYKVVDMWQDLLHDVGVALPYKEEWRGKDGNNNMVHDSALASYNLLLLYTKKVVTNEGWQYHTD